ncbi:Gfo/Idh/MocA family protein [Thioclava sp. 15-R06ZXC-3]|uniref:Gfo/Idh/MocA family protein n=1 Tax=Thioclava arctica TaxID=3238301 RepID=A0ABV3TPP0_9RHOB
MTKPEVGIGLIGAGFMGRCHANAFRAVGGLFDLPVAPKLSMLADVTPVAAERSAAALGFGRYTADWRALVADPEIDIVAITAPNRLHEPIALEAIACGKTVYCEKPLAPTAAACKRMTESAEEKGILTLVGFNFLRNPMIALAREIIESGEIGQVTSFRGRHAENYMCDPTTPHSFRTDRVGGGALADIGSHILSMARFLLGPIQRVNGTCHTIHSMRPKDAGGSELAPVEVDDMCHAILQFENGAQGSIEANWAATGRTMDLSFEVTGTKGAIVFSQERMNELLLWSPSTLGRAGFSRIEAGPDHPPYQNFCPAPGHHLGFNDLKVVEVAGLLTAWAGGPRTGTDFREAWAVQKTVEAIAAASELGAWQDIN